MDRNTVGRAALLSLGLGLATMACTPTLDADHVASLSSSAPGGAAAARAARRAHAALDAHRGDEAVAFAETSVARAPRAAAYRLLLAQAYLAAGRFASAERAANDALVVSPDLARARLTLALAQIARGDAGAARATLAGQEAALPHADLGLALALAGAPRAAVDMLAALVRDGESDARTRQNLAFALAMDGRWREARATAMQDTPPDAIEAQIAQWSRLAQGAPPAARVAALLGCAPAADDPGVPVTLALAPRTEPAQLRLALAPPEAAASLPPAALALPAPRIEMALAPAAPEAAPPRRPIATDPALVAAVVAPAGTRSASAAPAAPRLVRAAQMAAPRHPASVVALRLDPPRPSTPHLRLASLSPTPASALSASHAADTAAAARWVVQLGAYARAGALHAAWADALDRAPALSRFTPLVGQAGAGGALQRLSLSGFAGRAEAANLCLRLRARGAGCFVRPTGADHPLQTAQPRVVRIAMR